MSSAAITLRSGLYAETLAGLPRSGAELGTLLDELERSDKTLGLATLCIASGMGAATIIERI